MPKTLEITPTVTVTKLIELLKTMPQDVVPCLPVKDSNGHWKIHPITIVEYQENQVVFMTGAVWQGAVIILR